MNGHWHVGTQDSPDEFCVGSTYEAWCVFHRLVNDALVVDDEHRTRITENVIEEANGAELAGCWTVRRDHHRAVCGHRRREVFKDP